MRLGGIIPVYSVYCTHSELWLESCFYLMVCLSHRYYRLRNRDWKHLSLRGHSALPEVVLPDEARSASCRPNP